MKLTCLFRQVKNLKKLKNLFLLIFLIFVVDYKINQQSRGKSNAFILNRSFN